MFDIKQVKDLYNGWDISELDLSQAPLLLSTRDYNECEFEVILYINLHANMAFYLIKPSIFVHFPCYWRKSFLFFLGQKLKKNGNGTLSRWAFGCK